LTSRESAAREADDGAKSSGRRSSRAVEYEAVTEHSSADESDSCLSDRDVSSRDDVEERPARRRSVAVHRGSPSSPKSRDVGDKKKKPSGRKPARSDPRANRVETDDSTEDDGEQSGNKSTMTRRSWIKPGKYDGKQLFESYISQFGNCASYNRWNCVDKLAHLKACLTDGAAQVLWDSSADATDSYDKLVSLLRSRFGGSNQCDKFRMELKLRRREPGESLSALCQDVRRLMALAHPGPTDTTKETLACDYFIDSLNDVMLTQKLRERDLNSLDEALKAALKLETCAKSASKETPDDNQGRQRSKQVRGVTAGDAAAGDRAEVTRRLQELQSKMSAQQESEKRTQKQLEDRILQMEASIHRRLDEMSSSDAARYSFPRPVQQTEAPGVLQQQVQRPMESGGFQYNPNVRRGGGRNRRGGGRTGCYVCGEAGHWQYQCPRQAPQSAAEPAATDGPTVPVSSRGTRQTVDGSDVYLAITIGGRSHHCLLDSGCELSLAPLKVIKATGSLLISPTNKAVYAANGTPIRVVGVTMLPLKMDGYTTSAEVLVSEDIEEVMLGIDWLSERRCVWDFGRGELTVEGHSVKLYSGRQPILCRRVYAEKDVILPPRHQVDVVSRATLTDRRDLSSSWAVEARQLRPGVHVARTLLPGQLHGVKVRLINTTTEPKMVRAGTYLGVVDSVKIVSEDTELLENAVNRSSELRPPSSAPSSELRAPLSPPSSALRAPSSALLRAPRSELR